MADDLKPTDYAFLILLKVVDREISNPELDRLYGVRLTGEPYARLNGAGYVDSTKKGSTYWHKLPRKGEKALDQPWEIAGNGTEAKEQTRANKEKLFWAALAAWHAYHLNGGARSRVVDAAPVTDGRGLDERIRSAYAELAAEPGAWVSLTRLRPLFSDVVRTELDKALGRLLDAPDVNLEPEPNQKTLTVKDRQAAVRIGGEDRHLLAIGMR